MVIYTIGYSGWKRDALVDAVMSLDAVLVDTRLVPFSRNADFTRKALAETFAGFAKGGRAHYQWVKAFGNVNYKKLGAPVALLGFDEGVQEIRMHLDRRRAIALLCACKDPLQCHRTVVAEKLHERFGGRIVHLTPGRLRGVAQNELF